MILVHVEAARNIKPVTVKIYKTKTSQIREVFILYLFMQQGFMKKHSINWVLFIYCVIMLCAALVFRSDVYKPLKAFSFITGQVTDFSYGSYQQRKSGKFGGTVTRYGFKLKLEGQQHVFNINDLSQKESNRLKQELSSRPFVFIYYDRVILTKIGTQVQVHDIVIGKWSLERTKNRVILYLSVVGLFILGISIAAYRLFKDYKYLKAHVKY